MGWLLWNEQTVLSAAFLAGKIFQQVAFYFRKKF
jgi:hypothetical protein